MSRRDSASTCSVRRSRRPQTRLETSCTRTGRPRRHLPPNQAAGRRAKKRKAAPGVDGVTWQEYEPKLEDRLIDLHSRVHRGAFRAMPSRRVYIEKEDGRKRPLGVAALEDKIVQHAVATILNQIYEEDFLGF